MVKIEWHVKKHAFCLSSVFFTFNGLLSVFDGFACLTNLKKAY